MKYQNLVMGLMLIASILLFTTDTNKKVNITTYIALVLIASLGFIAPLLGVIISIPVFAIIYIKNYKSLANVWAKLEKIKISKN